MIEPFTMVLKDLTVFLGLFINGYSFLLKVKEFS
jgi:hypothetical protein